MHATVVYAGFEQQSSYQQDEKKEGSSLTATAGCIPWFRSDTLTDIVEEPASIESASKCCNKHIDGTRVQKGDDLSDA